MEALNQSRHVICEEPLAEHDPHFSMACTSQYVSAVRHEQREAISCCWAKFWITQEAHELEKREPLYIGRGILNTQEEDGSHSWEGRINRKFLLHPTFPCLQNGLTRSVRQELRG